MSEDKIRRMSLGEYGDIREMNYLDRDAMHAALEADARQWRRDRRERIATAAMQAMLASAGNGPTNEWSYYVFATRAVAYADALIEELEKEPQP
jgi:hypothetical protein